MRWKKKQIRLEWPKRPYWIDEDEIVVFCVARRDFEDAQHIDKNW